MSKYINADGEGDIDFTPQGFMWDKMLDFCSNRIDHYCKTVAGAAVALSYDGVGRQSDLARGLLHALIEFCKDYCRRGYTKEDPSHEKKSAPAILADACRFYMDQESNRANTLTLLGAMQTEEINEAALKAFYKLKDAVDYLGRQPSAWRAFIKFGRQKRLAGWTFEINYLRSDPRRDNIKITGDSDLAGGSAFLTRR